MISTDKTYENNIYVNQAKAIYRASLVSDVKYSLTVAIPKGQFYFGIFKVEFNLISMPAGKPLTLDFRG
jgi:hypothetical protein